MLQILCSVLWVYLQLLSELLNVIDEEDSSSLAGLTGFYDHDRINPVFLFLFGHVALQLRYLVGNDPRFRVESKIDGVLIFHFLEA